MDTCELLTNRKKEFDNLAYICDWYITFSYTIVLYFLDNTEFIVPI